MARSRKTIGITQLRRDASEIVAELREDRSEYVVTVDGKPVALLQPYDEVSEPAAPPALVEEARRKAVEAWLAEAAAIGKLISEGWPAGLSAADAVAEQRR